ncbi:MAG: ATP-dependent RNA helicase HrpA, partial [Acidimicrobiia bacterium]
MSPDLIAARRASIPDVIAFPEDLPITAWREELVHAIKEHQVIVVAGETGSGKSTQLPKLCLEAGRGIEGRIGHTQPRRIAARSIAERVASELGGKVGDLVGYTVRFTDEVADRTAIKVMTDGILLNELQRDRELRQYDTLIIDEAHERSLNIDFLLGYLKQLVARRPDLRVIITSATIDTARFSEHFDGAPIIEVEGRTYPVEVRYRPLDRDRGEPMDQTTAIGEAVAELAAEGTGDILVFCSGEREIRDAVETLTDLHLRHTEVLPLFGRLSAAEQHRVFSGHTGRRIVVATNVAETSLTVPGIRFVIDTGYARISRYSKRTKVQQLPIEAVSRASANQRAGRCGRLGPGIAIRLYAEDDFDSRPEFTDPEILRTNLSAVLLQMASIGLGAVADFPFIDPPDVRTIKDGISTLNELGAIADGPVGTRSWLTPTGKVLARLPLDPRLGRMLLAADENGCLDEVLTITSALSIQDPRERPRGKEEAADQCHAQFRDASSDFISWL